MKPGYKQTEVGVLPVDWGVREVSELAKIITGPFGTLLKASEYTDFDGVPQISVGEIGDGFFRVADHTSKIPPAVTSRLPQYLLRVGDVVFGRKGAVDRSALVTERENGWFLGSDGISVRPIVQCHPQYLAAQFSSSDTKSWLQQNAIGTTMASLNQKILGRVRLPFAPLDEQVAIAAALSDVDALLAGLDKLIAKKRDIKQATMQQLLTGKTRLPGFTCPWEVRRLGEMASIRNNKILPQDVKPDTLCVELEHVEQGTGKILVHGRAEGSSAAKYRFMAGDVLFGRLRSYLRKYWLAGSDGICSTEIWPIVANEDFLIPEFLFYSVQMDSFINAASVSYGTHMPRADWSVILNYEMGLPSVSEQVEIAAVLSDMDRELQGLRARRENTHLLKQGMMQELLTGRTRLV